MPSQYGHRKSYPLSRTHAISDVVINDVTVRHGAGGIYNEQFDINRQYH